MRAPGASARVSGGRARARLCAIARCLCAARAARARARAVPSARACGPIAQVQEGCGDVGITPVKPIDGFGAKWDELVARVPTWKGRRRVLVVGGGASGFELAVTMHARLHKEHRATPWPSWLKNGHRLNRAWHVAVADIPHVSDADMQKLALHAKKSTSGRRGMCRSATGTASI